MHKQVSNYFFENFLPLNPGENIEKLQTEFIRLTQKNKIIPTLETTRLTQAFTHKSFAHELGNSLKHNEVLEFLGDAVLDLIVTEILLEKYPELAEGKLSKLRSSIVNENTLSQLAACFNISEFILIGRGELKSNGHLKPSLMSNALEALLGAIYQEQGFRAAKNFLIQLAEMNQKNIWSLDVLNQFDAKTRLQELTMKKFKLTPKYECIQNENQTFDIICLIGKTKIAKSQHISKKKGMQELALKILNEQLLENTEIVC